MGTKVTVIIPTYNMENYLDLCLNSILNQTYQNIEILCIDDCSTDKTYEKLLSYKSKDQRISVFKNPKNSMVGYSRNFGLSKATGEYVLFVDPDDYCSNSLIEKTLNKVQITKSDCCLFGFTKFDSNTLKQFTMQNVLRIDDLLKKNIDTFSIDNYNVFATTTSCPMKLWRMELIKKYKLHFFENVFGEDSLFTYSGLYHSNKITYVNEPLYFYRINQKTNQTSSLAKRPIDGILTTNQLLNEIKIEDETIFRYFLQSLISRLKWIYSCQTNETKPIFLNELLDKEFFIHNINKKFLKTQAFIDFISYFSIEINKRLNLK